MKNVRRNTLLINLFFLLISVTACSKLNVADQAEEQYSRWKGLGIADYSYTLKVLCFCNIETVGPHKVIVKNNRIESVNGLPYDPYVHAQVKTIDQLFDIILINLAKKPYKHTLEYDRSLFFPRNIFFDLSESMADEEIGYQLTEFKAL